MTTPGFTIRKATDEDIEALVTANLQMAWETESKRLDPETLSHGVGGMLAHPHRGWYAVAEDVATGQCCGCLMITSEWSDWRNGIFWWIQSVYVWPEFRRRGVYRSLYSFVQEQAERTGGVCGFRLYVERDNRVAQQTYEQLGMQATDYRMYETTIETKRAT